MIIISISTAAMTKNDNTLTIFGIIYFNIKTVIILRLYFIYFCLFHKVSPHKFQFVVDFIILHRFRKV